MPKLLTALVLSLLMACATTESKKNDNPEVPTPLASNQNKESVKKNAKETQDHHTCKLNSDVRTIKKLSTSSNGCEVEYTKHGEKNVVATAENDMTYCDQIVNRIRRKLTSAGFECE